MCVFYDSHKPDLDNEDYWNAVPDEEMEHYPGSYNVRPTHDAPVVWSGGGRRKMSLFHFGMIPSWADDRNVAYSMFNARDDKLLSSQHWKPRLESKRCIIPANGFYEHYHSDEELEIPGGKKPTDKIPHYFRLKSTDLFGFAGIWDEWADKQTGEVVRSYAIITTGPNRIIKKIHNSNPRAPLILHRGDYDFWLGKVDKPQDLFDAGIFEPWPDEDMEAWQITKELDYNKNDEQLIQPVENPVQINGGGQGSLF